MADLVLLAKYPFTSAAKEHISGLTLELTYDLLEKAKGRVNSALVAGELPPLAIGIERTSSADIAAYAVARMLISGLSKKYYVSRYAVAESKRVTAYLRSEAEPAFLQVARELAMDVKPETAGYSVSVFDYLKAAPRALEYKLVNQRLAGGRVHLSREQLARVMGERVRVQLEKSLPVKGKIPENVLEAAKELERGLPKQVAEAGPLGAGTSTLKPAEYPPCIRKLLDDLAASENLPHQARFALAVFLLNKGVPTASIISLFRTAPDWNEQVTRYQVEYAAKKGYKAPSCGQMELYGLCQSECGCSGKQSFSPLRWKPRVVAR